MTNRSLFFICPTDCLERAIHMTFGSQSHFYTSLGNSVVFDDNMTNLIKTLVLKHHIQTIHFILAHNNIFVNDVLESQTLFKVKNLKNSYALHLDKKIPIEVLSNPHIHRSIYISHYLNTKIRALQKLLQSINMGYIRISGKIYDKQQNGFEKIYSDLICTAYFGLN